LAIRVVIADDHAVVREGTRQILAAQPELEIVGEAADGPAAIEVIRATRPDVAVLDMRLPGRSGIEVTHEVTSEQPETRVLILSAYDDEDYVAAAVQAGALGYVLKTATERELTDAVAAVAQGHPVVAQAIAQKLARLWGHAPAAPRGPLTPRETEVLELVTRGLRNKAIGQELGLSPRTVEVHLKNVYEKLGVSSRTQAVAYASAHHLFDEQRPGDPARLPT
jgi:DNA-binding NarL/FixJ family response regulator